jgi:plasmid stability protein
MTLSARASTFGGIVRLICLAVLKLMINSNFFGCSTICLQISSWCSAHEHLIAQLDRSFGLLHNGSILEEQMATLNIKKMPDRLYRKIQARANREHRSIAQEVIHILSQVTEDASSFSILDLQGLGKEVWSKVDASKHVSKERRGWD